MPDRAHATGPVTAGGVARTALSIYRRRFVLLAGVAAAVFSVLAVLEAAAGEYLGETVRDGQRLDAVALAVITGLWLLGSSLYVGLCDRVIQADFDGRPMSAAEAVRGLPYRRLVGLDVVLTVAVAVGLALLVVPGVLVFTLTCLAAPMVMMEGRGVVGALRRSVWLAGRHFWLVLAVVTVPIAIEHQVLHAIEALTHLPIAALIVLHALALTLVVAPVLVGEVVLAHELVAHNPDVEADQGVTDPGTDEQPPLPSRFGLGRRE